MQLEFFIHDPLTRFIAQIVSIIIVSRLLGIVTRRLGQPMVIAEITAGIFLGPSLLGLFWPDVGQVLFAPESLGLLQLVSQLGLILFMFLIGLELDPELLKGRAHTSIAISHTSIIVPFALGVGLAFYLYPLWSDPEVPFLAFSLFLGVAMSITAFPVLARILSERRLLRTRIGAVTIACAAVDDVTAWCVLAFVVAAARADGFGEAALTTGLSLAYIGVMFWGVRPLLRRIAARQRGEDGISQNVVAGILLLLFFSSWATELIGIHALFGAFLFGAVLPKESGFAHALAEKLEDLVLVVLLPLFFAFSGVRTQLSLLDTSAAWLTCLLIIFVACLGKFGGSAVAAKMTGLSWRESGALGILMNTRGLMELIVLNIGLDLGVISPAVFAMMVVMALVTTFMTTPILELVYPQELIARDLLEQSAPSSSEPPDSTRNAHLKSLLCVADKNTGPELLSLAQALGKPSTVHALHLVPPTERASYYVEGDKPNDPLEHPVLQPLLRQAQERSLKVRPLSFISSDPAEDICNVAQVKDVDLILLGWHKPLLSQSLLQGTVARVLRESKTGVGIFFHRGFTRAQRILVPFVGSPQDRAALSLVRQLAVSAPALELTLLDVRPSSDQTAHVPPQEISWFDDSPTVELKQEQRSSSSPVDAVLEESKNAYDLIVVGMGPEWGLELRRLGLGLQSERLVREAAISLLVVYHPNGVFPLPSTPPSS